jgi:hypothetical protein
MKACYADSMLWQSREPSRCAQSYLDARDLKVQVSASLPLSRHVAARALERVSFIATAIRAL